MLKLNLRGTFDEWKSSPTIVAPLSFLIAIIADDDFRNQDKPLDTFNVALDHEVCYQFFVIF